MPAPLPSLKDIPAPSTRNVTLRVDRSGERALRRGHPWLFADGATHRSHEGNTGDFAVVFDRARKFLAVGLYDADSPILVRVLHRGKPRPIDAAFFAERIAAAAELRAALPGQGTTGYRLVNGENEGLPGLVADRYADTLVVRLDTPAWLPHLSPVLEALLEAAGAERVVLRLSRNAARRSTDLHGLQDGAVLAGPDLEAPVVFEENHLRFECDPAHGQKTGFFLDQRENRERVERLAHGRTVVNAFAYTGGFSLYAARGGAKQILSIDQSAPALAAAKRNFALNPALASQAGRHDTLRADVFDAFPQLAAQGRRFALVIVDPPSFASKQADVKGALAAYEKLAASALGVTERGGVLMMASCSSRVASDDFFARIHAAARRAGRRLTELERSGHPLDHPVGTEEGRYLKCLFARAD